MKRTLSQLPALVSYFESHPDTEKAGRVKIIHDQLSSPLTKLTLQFLEFILLILNDFNILFQLSETKIGMMADEMDRLLRKLMVKCVKMCHVRGQNLQQIQFQDRSIQHDNQLIAVDMKTRDTLCQLEEDGLDPQVKDSF